MLAQCCCGEAWMVPCQKEEVSCANRVKQVSTECSPTEWQGKFQQGSTAWSCSKGWQNRCCYSTQQRQISQVPEWGCTTHCWAVKEQFCGWLDVHIITWQHLLSEIGLKWMGVMWLIRIRSFYCHCKNEIVAVLKWCCSKSKPKYVQIVKIK